MGRMTLSIVAVLGLLGCTQSGEDREPIGDRKVRVLATTGMVADLTRNVGGGRVEVDALMGPGVDPHLYKASAGDLARLRKADLVLYNGHHLEGKMGEVLEKVARSREVRAIAESVPADRLMAPEDGGGHPDPHIWFDVALWAETTTFVADALAKVDPDHAAGYRSRAGAYREKLLALDREVRQRIATIPESQRVLITSHDAFRYFGRAYGIEVTGLQGISTVLEAGVNDRRRIVDLVVGRGIKAIFVESSVAPKTIEAVRQDCAARGHEVRIGGTLYSDAMGDTPPDDTYEGMVRTNVERIVEALR
jgi:manganese/zinc/iron transport system substrate-binding protein